MQFLSVLPLEFQEDLKEFLLNADVDDNVKTLKICDVKEYDKWQIIFSGKKDIDVDISVNREDFKVIE